MECLKKMWRGLQSFGAVCSMDTLTLCFFWELSRLIRGNGTDDTRRRRGKAEKKFDLPERNLLFPGSLKGGD